MTRKIIWIATITVLILLTVRMFAHHVNGVRNEKVWYLEQLGFEFSGELDSAGWPGRVLFHVTGGHLDTEKESEIKEQLKYNGMLDLLLYEDNGKLDLVIPDPHHYLPGDSLYLNSKLKVVRFYRDGKLLGEHDLVKSLRGRPF